MKFKLSAEMISSFSNHQKYIEDIVLGNLHTFISCFQKNRTDDRGNSRLFFNAIISINHIPDYMFWEWEEELKEIGIIRESALYSHLEKIEQFSFMKEVREVANAAKHCVRRDKSKMKAKDITKVNLNMNVEVPEPDKIKKPSDIKIKSNISSDTYYEKNYDVIDKAWRFWAKYHSDVYKEIILKPLKPNLQS